MNAKLILDALFSPDKPLDFNARKDAMVATILAKRPKGNQRWGDLLPDVMEEFGVDAKEATELLRLAREKSAEMRWQFRHRQVYGN